MLFAVMSLKVSVLSLRNGIYEYTIDLQVHCFVKQCKFAIILYSALTCYEYLFTLVSDIQIFLYSLHMTLSSLYSEIKQENLHFYLTSKCWIMGANMISLIHNVSL